MNKARANIKQNIEQNKLLQKSSLTPGAVEVRISIVYLVII
jgi:hypothetical protein